jgi:uncharacterized delta-60 repeat protein
VGKLARPFVLVLLIALAGLSVSGALAAGQVEPEAPPLSIIPVPRSATQNAAPSIGDFAEAPGGAVLAAITSPSLGHGDFLAARFGPDGELDRGFGEDGFTATLPNPRGLQGQAIATRPGGGSVLVGYHRLFIKGPMPVLAAYTADGTLDPRFGTDGRLEPKAGSLGVRTATLHDVAVGGDGTILAVGATEEKAVGVSSAKSGRFRPSGIVVAYRPDGRLDRRFGDEGRVLFPPTKASKGSTGYTGLTSIALESSGRILVAGFQRSRLFVARLLPDGSPDRGFGDDGRVVIKVDRSRYGCYGNCPSSAPIALLPHGKILVLNALYSKAVALIRLRPDGRPDASFGTGGVRRVKASRSFLPFAMAVAGGRIVLAGWELEVTKEAEFAYAVRRYRLDGRPDRTFGRGGLDQRTIKNAASAFAALARSDGSVWVGGSQSGESPNALLLARYPAP